MMNCPKPDCGRELKPLLDEKGEPVSDDWHSCGNPGGAHRHKPVIKDGERWWRDEDGNESRDPDQSGS